MGCDWMGCTHCGIAFDWNYADYCERCENSDRFICERCGKCVECGKSESDKLTEDEITDRDSKLVDQLRLSQITKDNMTDEELLKQKNSEIRQVGSNYKVLLNTLNEEKQAIAYRIRKKKYEAKKVKELEELKTQKELAIKKLEEMRK